MHTKKAFMRELVIAIGGNLEPTENRKSWLVRVARAAGLKPRAVHDVWYGGPVTFEAARKLKSTAEKKQNEQRHIVDQLETLAARLEAIDADFHRPHVDFLRDLAAQRRGDLGGKE